MGILAVLLLYPACTLASLSGNATSNPIGWPVECTRIYNETTKKHFNKRLFGRKNLTEVLRAQKEKLILNCQNA